MHVCVAHMLSRSSAVMPQSSDAVMLQAFVTATVWCSNVATSGRLAALVMTGSESACHVGPLPGLGKTMRGYIVDSLLARHEPRGV